MLKNKANIMEYIYLIIIILAVLYFWWTLIRQYNIDELFLFPN